MEEHWFERPNGANEHVRGYLVTCENDKFSIENIRELSTALFCQESSPAFVFLNAPISLYSQEVASCASHIRIFNAPSYKVSTTDYSKLKRLVQIRGRGKAQGSVEVKVYSISNVKSLQPDCGRVVANDETLVDTFILDTNDVFTNEKVIKLVQSADILLCRANHSIQYQAFWLAISVGAVPVLPEGPAIKSYGAQPILNGLLEHPQSRYSDDNTKINNTINGFITFYSVLVSQLRWYYANGLTTELLQLCLDEPALPQNGVIN